MKTKHLGGKRTGEEKLRGEEVLRGAGDVAGVTGASGAAGAAAGAAGTAPGAAGAETFNAAGQRPGGKGATETETELDEKAAQATQAAEADKMHDILELTNDLQRTRADFENFRRRAEERQEAAQQAARMATVHKLLPLLDDLGRAIGTYKELAPLAKSLEKTMGELGLKSVSAQPGEEFNPDIHDAVSVEGEGEKEVVGEVLRAGYYYEGELLRPAMVKVQRQD